jgi:hypothetical protein
MIRASPDGCRGSGPWQGRPIERGGGQAFAFEDASTRMHAGPGHVWVRRPSPRPFEVHAHQLRHALFGHGHAEQRSIRAIVTAWCVMIRNRVWVWSRHLVEQIAEPADIGIVERCVDLIQHADRRGIGEEHREDQRQRRQRLLPTGQSDSVDSFLPGGWHRISSPASSGSSLSTRTSRASPPPKRWVKSFEKLVLTCFEGRQQARAPLPC